MVDLKIRRIAFDFEGVDFVWNRNNPEFAITMNKLSFFAIAFEKYICQAMRDVEPLIKDPRVLQEAKDFRAQEGLHSMAHRKHCKALIAQTPALQPALDLAIELYDELYASESLKYHIAYTGGLESIFTPSFKLMLDHRENLFNGDARVASLLLWHFCEEIEHRSSGLMVYDHVYGNYWYRVSRFKGFMAHVGKVIGAITEEFEKAFPELPKEWLTGYSNFKMPRLAKWKSAFGITMSQMPWHNPQHQPLPKYFDEWSAIYNSGADVTRVFGEGSTTGQPLAAAA